MDKSKRMTGGIYRSTGMRKLSPNSKAYKAAYKRNKLTGSPDIYQTGRELISKGDK